MTQVSDAMQCPQDQTPSIPRVYGADIAVACCAACGVGARRASAGYAPV